MMDSPPDEFTAMIATVPATILATTLIALHICYTRTVGPSLLFYIHVVIHTTLLPPTALCKYQRLSIMNTL